MCIRHLSFFFALILFGCTLFAQRPEGTPSIQNYSPHKSGYVSPENWAVVQDKRGIMYFGNSTGVLEFDGITWNLIEVSNKSLVRSLAVDENGIVYVGAVGEFGFLSINEHGKTVYHSLVNKLPEAEREFADVWKTYATQEGIFFQTFDKLIRISKKEVKIWKPESSFHFSYYLSNRLYIIDREKGLKQLVNEKLELIKGGSAFSGMRIYSMLPYSKDRVLLATRENGLFTMSIDSLPTPLQSPANISLINDQVYAGASLTNGRFVFATLKKGVIIIDSSGNVVQKITKENGLQEEIVKNVFVDNQQDLWLALGKGIARVEISSPIAFFDEGQGVNGFVQGIHVIHNTLYVATSSGVFFNSGVRFVPVNGINSQTLCLAEFVYKKDTILLAASESGIYQLQGANAKLIHEGFGYFLYQSRIAPLRIFLGMNDGLISLKYEKGKWLDEDYIDGVEKEIRSIAEDKDGNLWLGTPFDGVLKVKFPDKKRSIDNLGTKDGLPDMKYNIPFNFGDQLIFATVNGFYRFNETTKTFAEDSILGKEFQKRQIFRFVANKTSDIWLFTVKEDQSRETGIATLQPGGTYNWYAKPFGKISDREIHAIYPDVQDVTWLGGPDGLLRYNARIKKDFSRSYATLIRNVIMGDDTLFWGTFYRSQDSLNIPLLNQPDILKLQIPYSNHSLSFEYASASYGGEESTVYSVYLEGHEEEGWSDWSTKRVKEYNLKEGNYVFHVKARNIYGTESTEATYAFTILPPWYLTAWAFVGYAVVVIGLIYLIIRLSLRRLIKQKEKLEGIVKDRTAALEHQKELVEEKNKDIMDSINYAQRIQRALLASDKLLKTQVPNHFVFFQPKDVVSGDFYWGSVLSNNQFALVTADSTGHGVPGAIMSILNISCLSEAVNAQRLVVPGEILNFTRTKIIQHMANDGSAEGGKDGMDCSLSCFDLDKMQMSYAAANNPLWIVRNKEILEFNPDKMPVGKHDRDTVPFSSHLIELQKGDMVYTCTDGMPDQFGGPKGKKFMYKQLKELLVSISHLSMQEQKEQISKAINNWKGDLEQVDDVCVIGVKI